MVAAFTPPSAVGQGRTDMHGSLRLATFGVLLVPGLSLALAPDGVFEKVSASIVIVRAREEGAATA